MKIDGVRYYYSFSSFLRNEYTDVPGKKHMIITPLLMAFYNMRKQFRKEIKESKWIVGDDFSPYKLASQLNFKKAILLIYFPLINISVIFITTNKNTIKVIPCHHKFVRSDTDYDPASIYFYRMGYLDDSPTVNAACRYRYNINDILSNGGINITYQYLVETYTYMLENIIADVDAEYNIMYRIQIK